MKNIEEKKSNTINNLLKAIIVGIGGIAPGLEGSVLLIIFGLYEKTVDTIGNLFKNFKKNFLFLIPLFLGFGIGILVFSRIIDYFLNTFEVYTRFLFLGLVFGIIPLFNKKVKKNGFNRKYYIIIILAFVFGSILFLFNKNLFPTVTNLSIIQSIFLGFAVAVSTIIPGVDNVIILSALGLYEIYVKSIASINITVLAPAAIGFGIGVLVISFLMNKLIKKYYTMTFSIIFGLFISIIPSILNENCYLGANTQSIISIFILIIGFLISYFFGNFNIELLKKIKFNLIKIKKVNKKNIINTLIIATLTLVALYFNLKDIFIAVLKELTSINILFLLVALFLILVYCLLDGIAIAMFSKLYNKTYNIFNGFKTTVIGMFFASISPFASGSEIAKTYTLSKQGLKVGEAISVSILNFIIYQMALLLWGISAILLKINYFYTNYTGMFYMVLLGFLVNILAGLILVLSAKSKLFQDFISNKCLKILNKLRLIKDYDNMKKKFDNQIESFRSEFNTLFKNRKLLIKVLFIQISRLACFFSITFFCLRAIDSTISFSMFFDTTLLIVLIYIFLAATPIPGDSGISETIYILIFTSLFNKIVVSSSMIIWRFVSFYVPVIIGALLLIFNKELKGTIKKEIEEQS